MTFMLRVRRKVEVNTDPQRRCYNGCHASSEMQWSPWQTLFARNDKASLEETMAVFQRANPTNEYKITEA